MHMPSSLITLIFFKADIGTRAYHQDWKRAGGLEQPRGSSSISSSRSNTNDKKRARAAVREYLDIMAQTARLISRTIPRFDGQKTTEVGLKTNFNERSAHFSPDGRWVAYQSNESGRHEIYVRPFVEPTASAATGDRAGGQWQVSTAGGIYPRWRPDGKELYYIGPDSPIPANPPPVLFGPLEFQSANHRDACTCHANLHGNANATS
jgi:hypothetical protein